MIDPAHPNPIPLGSFYQLRKRMRISKIGGFQYRYRRIKEALERIVATTVKSEGAFYNKTKQEWVEDVFHLYDRVIFKGKRLPNGEIADSNYLFLSSWYLENINALYVKPIDFKYYRSLKSTIAQRLYELLGVKFYRFLWEELTCLRYRYSTLCQLLPITRQRYFSKAKEKLDPAHEELRKTDFLDKVAWEEIEGERDDWFIFYYPGPRALEEMRRYGVPEEAVLERGGRAALQAPEQGPEEIKGLVEYMVEVLGDEHSRPFYTKVARLCPSNVIYRLLSEVKDDWLQGRVRKSKGAHFTDKIKRYCQERGIDLGLKPSRADK
ncbi:TPA: RepB family plasmid replication initiator protein, partial [Candidatus Bipolaricaulota bacterium]|nr:RepB family plasmid replication initiator protein [Candidatus Bipolaricaulota bacterium]